MAMERMTTELLEGIAHDTFRNRPAAALVSAELREAQERLRNGLDASDFLGEAPVSKAELQKALAKDEADLAKYKADLKKLKAGKKVPNLTVAGAEEMISGFEAAIRNKRKSLSKMKESLDEERDWDTQKVVKTFHRGLARGLGEYLEKTKYRVVTHGLTSAEVHVGGEQAGPGVMSVTIDLKALNKKPPEQWVQLSSKTGTKWAQTIKTEKSKNDWGYVPFSVLGDMSAKVIASKMPKREAVEEQIEKSPYDTVVSDKNHLPKKLSARYVRELKKGIGKGTKVEVVKSRSMMPRGWDYGNYTVLLITLPGDRGSLNAGFTLFVAQGEASGNVQLDHSYGGVISTKRGPNAEGTIKGLIDDTARHLHRPSKR